MTVLKSTTIKTFQSRRSLKFFKSWTLGDNFLWVFCVPESCTQGSDCYYPGHLLNDDVCEQPWEIKLESSSAAKWDKDNVPFHRQWHSCPLCHFTSPGQALHQPCKSLQINMSSWGCLTGSGFRRAELPAAAKAARNRLAFISTNTRGLIGLIC